MKINLASKSLMSFFILAMLFTMVHGVTVSSETGSIIYVSAGVASTGNGTSWSQAFKTLQEAISAAQDGDEIWIAAGTYKPTVAPTGDIARDRTFLLKNGVKIYGGFVGTETDLSERNYNNNVTILSGDIDNNNILDANNTHHVVLIIGGGADTVLDGVTITNGYTSTNGSAQTLMVNGVAIEKRFGGGIYICNGATPVIKNIIVKGNRAHQRGGGIYINASSPTIENVQIIENTAEVVGGGGLFIEAASAPTITNSVISGNWAEGGTGSRHGGGVYNTGPSSVPLLTKVTITYRNLLLTSMEILAR